MFNDSLPKEIFETIGFWSPKIQVDMPKPGTTGKQIKIASLMGERLYNGLRYEADLYILTPTTWECIFKFVKPDFILVESCISSFTGHWYHSQTSSNKDSTILFELIKYAKEKHIPAVYWFTQDYAYYSNYEGILSQFDIVFCSDPKVFEKLKKKGVNAELLKVAIQPKLYNGFIEFEENNENFEIDILYDGIVDIFRDQTVYNILKILPKNKLRIIDSTAILFNNKLALAKEFEESILGCVTFQGRIAALKYAKCLITFPSPQQTRLTQQWMALEAAACNVLVIYFGTLEQDDIRKDFVIEVDSEKELLALIKQFDNDSLFRDRHAHIAWRYVYSHHTFRHRLRNICQNLNLNYQWDEFPLVTVVSPSYRKELLCNLKKTYESFVYDKKELIIIYNNNNFSEDFKDPSEQAEDVRLFTLPQEYFTGACFNFGITNANGKYCFKIDDDDRYGEYYLYDYILHMRSIDADVFGKARGFYHFERENKIYIDKSNNDRKMRTYDCSYFIDGHVWLSGNSIAGKTSVLNKLFPDNVYAAADTVFNHNAGAACLKMATTDNFNMIAIRREDKKSHTWQLDDDSVQKTLSKTTAMIDSLLI